MGTVIALLGLVFLTTIPLGEAVLGVPPRAAFAGLGSILVVSLTAVALFHVAGIDSRAYRVADHVETLGVQLAAMFLVASSGRGASCFWLVYLAHLSVLPVEPPRRRFIGRVIVWGPWLVVAWFAFQLSDPTATLFAIGGAIAGAWTWSRTQRRKMRIAELTAEREAMSDQEQVVRVRDERLRIARDLHRSVGQDLEALMKLVASLRQTDAATAASLDELDARIRASADELRATIWELDRERSDWRELAAYVEERLVELVQGAARLELRVGACDGGPRVVPASHGLALLRIMQESVRNALRHGRVSCLSVDISFSPSAVRASIVDDGCGLPARQAKTTGGLANMHARAQKLGGSLVISSDAGTRIELELPIGGARRA
ncbi:MAG: hypothetical protein KF819_03990 [Labilithrix sp.]|nr:hypothetical protein [Labilithrix sp.]